MTAQFISPTDRTERRLLILAGAFMGVYSIALTLSEAARLRTWQVSYPWQHWIGLAIWAGFTWLAHRLLSRFLPERDPFLFPIADLLSGWGLLTIWRLSTRFGLRQSAWLLVIGLVTMLAMRANPSNSNSFILPTLRRYKYIWLSLGLVLTAATLILGKNPMGAGPRLWLGCCGIYFQPSELLKLLLIVYLAAYLADRQGSASPRARLLPLLTPTLVMTGLAMLLLLFQRDLGTAALFLVLYAAIVFAGTGDYRILIFSALALIVAGAAGYSLFDVVSQRMDAWINPWLDPSGRSFQIVQSLLAVANGGMLGRGPGMGSPGLVPIAQSDFIFSTISEESGLLGALVLLGLLAMLVNRGTHIALGSSDPFLRLLSTGLVVHLAGQSFLIIAGNVRLLPLTGVTLPFVSYGGSSLVISFFELLCLLLISNQRQEIPVLEPEKLKAHTRTSLFFSGGLMLGFAGLALVVGWWSLVRGPALLTRTDNLRRTVADRYVRRGSILDRHDLPLAESRGQAGDIRRDYPYPALGPILGYTDPVYGQAGLEASLDPRLRGLQGYPGLTLWWEHLLYGYPPPGLDVRLSLDLTLQEKSDELLSGDPGAIVLLNASTGEILAIASSPAFDANTLASNWETLVNDPAAPLFDRAAMGLYPPGSLLGSFLLPGSEGKMAMQFGTSGYADCAFTPAQPTLAAQVSAGCPQSIDRLLDSFSQQEVITLLEGLGLFTAPAFPIETLSSPQPADLSNAAGYLKGQEDPVTGDILRVSPLQMALAAATLSNAGGLPSPRLVMAYETPSSGWVTAPVTGQSHPVLQAASAKGAADALGVSDIPIWEVVSIDAGETNNLQDAQPGYSWYIGGTLSDWKGASLAIAVLLEEVDPSRVQEIGRTILQAAMNP